MLGARAHGVGIGIGQRGMQLGDMVAVVFVVRLRFGAGQIGFQLAQVSVAIDGVLDGGTIQRRRFLRNIGHAPARREIDIALVGMQLATQHGEQAGLAGAIGADQADLVARIECQVDIFQERLDATLEGDLLETDHR